mmetsp:Transcript_38663/g.123935  ORF Transcript_38663/g.123935 Transcript_38663/m.123935 type:complete len:218 (-) Transcript_38663:65-718(-)
MRSEWRRPEARRSRWERRVGRRTGAASSSRPRRATAPCRRVARASRVAAGSQRASWKVSTSMAGHRGFGRSTVATAQEGSRRDRRTVSASWQEKVTKRDLATRRTSPTYEFTCASGSTQQNIVSRQPLSRTTSNDWSSKGRLRTSATSHRSIGYRRRCASTTASQLSTFVKSRYPRANSSDDSGEFPAPTTRIVTSRRSPSKDSSAGPTSSKLTSQS